jgi:HK97 family phage portal protein
MGYLSRAFEKRASADIIGLSPGDPALAAFWGGPSTASVQDVSSDTALRVSTVFACVNRISQTLAMLPLLTMHDLPGGGHEIAKSHRLYKQLRYQSNRWQTAYDFRLMMQAHVLLRGNGYARIVSAPGRGINELVPMHPDRVWPFVITPNGVTYYMYDNSPPPPPGSKLFFQYFPINANMEILLQSEVFHVTGLSTNGIVGINPIKKLREAIGLAMATEEHGARVFSNGAQISKAFRHPNKLSKDAYDRLKSSLGSEFQGVRNSNKTIILEEGMDISTLSMTSEDAQFLETRAFQVEDIARIFSVPLVLIGHSGDKASTYASAEQFVASFITHTMQPHFVSWEQAIQRDLFYPSEMGIYRAAFNVDEMLRGDMAGRAAYYTARFGVASISPDEIRAKEGESPIADGSGTKHYIMSNMIPLEMAGINAVPKAKHPGAIDGQSA